MRLLVHHLHSVLLSLSLGKHVRIVGFFRSLEVGIRGRQQQKSHLRAVD